MIWSTFKLEYCLFLSKCCVSRAQSIEILVNNTNSHDNQGSHFDLLRACYEN
jgi:hypothetical protein